MSSESGLIRASAAEAIFISQTAVATPQEARSFLLVTSRTAAEVIFDS